MATAAALLPWARLLACGGSGISSPPSYLSGIAAFDWRLNRVAVLSRGAAANLCCAHIQRRELNRCEQGENERGAGGRREAGRGGRARMARPGTRARNQAVRAPSHWGPRVLGGGTGQQTHGVLSRAGERGRERRRCRRCCRAPSGLGRFSKGWLAGWPAGRPGCLLRRPGRSPCRRRSAPRPWPAHIGVERVGWGEVGWGGGQRRVQEMRAGCGNEGCMQCSVWGFGGGSDKAESCVGIQRCRC